MGGIAFIAAIVIAATGMQQNIRYGDELNRHYMYLPTLLGGFAATISLIGLVLTLFGGDRSGMFIGGLAVALIVHIPHIRQAVADVTRAKNSGMADAAARKLGPVPVLIRLLLVGIGKVMHLLLVLTLIGIPLYRMMESGQRAMDAYCDQVELRDQLEAEEEFRRRQEIMEEASRKAAERAKAQKETPANQ